MDKRFKIILIALAVLVLISLILSSILGVKKDEVQTEEELRSYEPELDYSSGIEDVTNNESNIEHVTKMYMKYLDYKLYIGENSEIICENQTDNIDKDITNIDIEELYKMDNLTGIVYFVKFKVNNDFYNYIIVEDQINYTYKMIVVNDNVIERAKNNIIDEEYKEYIAIEKTGINDSKIYVNVVIDYMFDNFKYLIRNNPDEAFDKVELEYRNIKFTNKEQFLEFVNNIDLLNQEQDGFSETKNSGSYIYRLKFGNQLSIYFYVNKDMSYTVRLDNYTIKDKDYSSLSNEEKAKSVAEDFFKMVNYKDFERAYAHLDETFRNNYYPTVESFKNAMEEYLPETVVYGLKTMGNNISGVYMFDVTLQGADKHYFTDEDEVYRSHTFKKKMDFVVKLDDETNYRYSFSFNE